ncbi:unnamed protein product [Adineta steineri]|uniref:G-protein coupled receptors family 1 profile domain-containing protein n=1 Tax=Adineta steineri TaxID=433720 RepID=A0A815QDX2_9BILA|nr:unnamed protein product [Adineta steineri]CAF4037153.1 unnamed protein product [Adineta steineri]
MDYSLINAGIQITRSIVPIIIILGVLSNFLNIIILRRSNLKRYGCSLYFITMSISNIFYLGICVTYNLLLDGYQIDLVRYSSILCKLISYFLNFCPYISVCMLILASIDRYLSSSLSAQRRKLSNIQNARWSILFISIIISIYMLGNAILFDVYNNDIIGCTSKSNNIFSEIYFISEVIIYLIILPFLMLVFGLLTIYNTKKLNRNRIVVFRYRRTERQLARMLIVQVLSHVILNLPFLIMFLMLLISITFPSNIIFYFLYLLFKILFYMAFITPFFLYILSAQLYRAELILLLKKTFRIYNRIAIRPMPGNRN